jgi:hypothetical protein
MQQLNTRTMLLEHIIHLSLILVIIIEEARIRVDAAVAAFAHHNVAGGALQVGVEFSAECSLHAVHWPHHLEKNTTTMMCEKINKRKKTRQRASKATSHR